LFLLLLSLPIPEHFYFFSVVSFFPIHAELLSGSTRFFFFFFFFVIHTARSASVTEAKSKLNIKYVDKHGETERERGGEFVVHHSSSCEKSVHFLSRIAAALFSSPRVEMCRYHLVIKLFGGRKKIFLFFVQKEFFFLDAVERSMIVRAYDSFGFKVDLNTEPSIMLAE
jgi:hypothetical protein